MISATSEINTAPSNYFIDRFIPLVWGMQTVDNIFTERFYPSEYGSSVIFHYVANSVRNLKKPNTDSIIDGEARKKKISHKNFTDGII